MMLLESRNLKKTFKRPFSRQRLTALQDVSFSLEKGGTLGVLGESGSGKSTLAKLILKLEGPDAGQILFEGRDLRSMNKKDIKDFRKKVQIIFQDPYLSLDPRMTVLDALREPFLIHGLKDEHFLKKSIDALLDQVELGLHFLGRFPRQLSGGECQRVAIARALSLGPELLVCDEPVSALDQITQARILNLLLKLQKEKGMALVFISHDLKVVRHMSDAVLVLKDGVVCEFGPADRVFQSPQHPYSRALLAG